MKLGICIVFYGKSEESFNKLSKVIRSVEAQTYLPKTVILIVNNAVELGIHAKNIHKKLNLNTNKVLIKIIDNENNGYSGGNNKGLNILFKKYNADMVLILNPDVELDRHYLEEIDLKNDTDCIKSGFEMHSKNEVKLLSTIPFKINAKILNSMNYLQGSNIILSKSVYFKIIKKHGYFFKNYFMYFEDNDLFYRLRVDGFCFFKKNKAKFKHRNMTNKNENYKKYRVLYSIRNSYFYVIENFSKAKMKDKIKFIFYLFYFNLIKVLLLSVLEPEFRKSFISGLNPLIKSIINHQTGRIKEFE